MSASKTSTEALARLRAAVPPAAERLGLAIADAGGRAFLVGGEVRDTLLGKQGKDFDIEVFGLPVDALERLLRRMGRVNAVGRSFGVLKWRPHGAQGDDFDVSIPRRDSKVGPGHKGIAVEGDPDMPIEEAARRRDLTVNALMFDLVAHELVDPWGGLADLEAGLLRAVDRDTFLEDPLRALRAVQFAARLGFEAHPSLLALCREAALEELPAERVQGEWEKLLLKAATPSVGFRLARATDQLARVFPEVAQLASDDVLDRLVPARDALEGRGERWALMLAGWLHGAAPDAVEATLDRLWLHKVAGFATRDAVIALCEHTDLPLGSDPELRRAATRVPMGLLLPLRAALGDATEAAERRVDALGIRWSPPQALLLGRHLKELGIPPGRHMGPLLAQVYEAQLDGRVQDVEEARGMATRLWDDREA